MKKVLIGILVIAIAACCCGCVCLPMGGTNKKVSDFYDKVSEAQELLETVGDDIYDNWHAAIYDDEFNDDIDLAVSMAQLDNADNLDRLEELDGEISDLFKDIKDSKNGDLIKDVMYAYDDYYELVVNVSGSFNDFSAKNEDLNDELISALNVLSYEI